MKSNSTPFTSALPALAMKLLIAPLMTCSVVRCVYWFAMTLPVNLVRELFGHASALVP